MDLPDGPELLALSKRIKQIQTDTAGVALGGMFVPNSRRMAQVIVRLNLYKDRLAGGERKATCYCRLFATSMFMRSDHLARIGRVDITQSRIFKEEYTTRHWVTCADCAAKWLCEDEIGWHVPTYKWTRLD